ncbi:hypothetical protein SteCoe_19751 [Stentor coeruleus]|uniref:EF-hand domain-containing protein n=1 Tax=Stentor coeruleus TaxID=5963 RepID=A0A1R2BTP0_9CILI|nr:hypothetical protein SteCoe_19751 [Stentor coeruleus]
MATGICESVLFELNQCRSNPSKYSNKLSSILKFYKGKIFEKPGYPSFETQEGPENVQACIKYLKSVRPAAPLEWSDGLAKAAQDHIDDLGPKGLTGHDSSNGQDAAARIEKYGQWSGQLGENVDYGNCEGEDIVVSLLIDDGVLARGQRLNIMKREHVYIGIGFGYHSEHEYMCVIVFAEVFIENLSPMLKPEMSSPKKEPVKAKPVPEKNAKAASKKKIMKSAFETFDVAGFEREGLMDEDILEIKAFFDGLDLENSGMIDPENVKAALDKQDFDITTSTLMHLLGGFDCESPKVDFDEFLDLVSEGVVKNKQESKVVTKTQNKVEEKKTVQQKVMKYEETEKYEEKRTVKTEEKTSSKVQTKQALVPDDAKPGKEVKETKPEKPSFERENLNKDDIYQIKEIFDAYDSESLGWVNLEELTDQIRENGYEEGVIDIVDTLMAIDCKGKRKVKFEQLLDMLDWHKETVKNPTYKSRVYTKTEVVTTTKYSSSNQDYTKTTKKTTTKYSEEQEAFEPAEYYREGLTEEEITEIKEAFDLFDVEKCGTIETRDLKNAMEAQGFQYKSPIIFKMVCELDVEGKGRVDFDEFLDMMTEHAHEDSSMEEIRKVFNLFDVDHTGFIELKNLKKIAYELGETLNEEDIMELITKSDADGDGKVSFQEFYDIMSRTIF